MKVKICKTTMAQIKGLMFSRKKNLMFVYKNPIYVDLHMMFVFFNVDALYVNEKGEIVEIKHMKPFRGTYKAKHKAKYVIELSKQHNFVVGDKAEINGNEISKAL